MTDVEIKHAQKVVGHTFADVALLKESLTHASIADDRLKSNERMEFLGDAVLDLIMCEHLYRRFPNYAEGDLTKVKSAIVSRQTCAAVSREVGLDKLLFLGKGITSRTSIPPSLAAAVYESVVAAIYLDAGLETTREFVLRTMETHVARICATIHQHNYKATLQQFVHRETGHTPIYELLDEKGPDHSKCFEIGVTIHGKRYPTAWGMNKKIAEQKAALLTLEQMGVLNEQDVIDGLEQLSMSEPQFDV